MSADIKKPATKPAPKTSASGIPADVTTKSGRKLSLRETDPGDMLDLIEAAGSAAGSVAWMRYALMMCSVHAIDDKPVLMPVTKEAVRELARKIGNDGVEALSDVFFPKAEPGNEDDLSPELEAAKN